MIKAKKSLFAALFAVMMVVAFIPAMAFADDTNTADTTTGDPTAVEPADPTQGEEPTPAAEVEGTWAADYSTVTVDGYTYQAVRTFNEDGSITAVPDPKTDVDWAIPNTSATYYDLNNAVFAIAKGNTVKAEYKNAAYTKGSVTGLQFSAPSYVTNKDAEAVFVPFTTLNQGAWQGAVKGDEDYDSTLATEQTFTLTLDITFKDAKALYEFYGVVPSKTVKVQARAANASDVLFFEDEVSAKTEDAIVNGAADVAKSVTFDYDGAAHKIVNSSVTGLTVSYEVFNKTTGKYDAVSECPAVTNVADEAIVKAKVSWVETTTTSTTTSTTTKTNTITFTLKVAPAKAPTFGFDQDGNASQKGEYKVEGSEFDGYSYIIVKDAANATDADKAAAKANNETLLAYFKDYYEVTSEATKANPDKFALAIEPKKLSADEVKALETKYADLMKNFGVTTGNKIAADGSSATVYVNETDVVPEIEFVDSPTAMTYKAKKLKKKAASFTVKAEATNGAAVSYKLINAPAKIKIDKTTGKVTLKKGLKKGTYKIKVKAYITKAYTNEYGLHIYPSETHDIKIKVKK